MKLLFESFLLLFFLFSALSCADKAENKKNSTVMFHVGFDTYKHFQGVYTDPVTGEQEIYFFKSEFNPRILFFDLSGRKTDSICLAKTVKDIENIKVVSVLSKDSIILFSVRSQYIVGIHRNGDYWLKKNLYQLSGKINDDKYEFYLPLFSATLMDGNRVFMYPMWYWRASDRKAGVVPEGRGAYLNYFYKNSFQAPHICKIEPLMADSLQFQFGLRGACIDPTDVKSYSSNRCYSFLNHKLLYADLYDRNLYVLDPESLLVTDTIPVIPEEYSIPKAFAIESERIIGPKENKEIKGNSYIVSMQYSPEKKQYYIFVKTGVDKSTSDELGYPFKIFVYDEQFRKQKQIAFDTDQYTPKSAMMTSKGLFIEKISRGEDSYGKRTYEIFDF